MKYLPLLWANLQRKRVRTALSTINSPGRDAIALAGAIEAFTVERLTQPR